VAERDRLVRWRTTGVRCLMLRLPDVWRVVHCGFVLKQRFLTARNRPYSTTKTST
jgi:hypothetical protein